MITKCSTGGLSLILLLLSACVPLKDITPEQQVRAMGLIDQGVLLMRQGELDRAEAAFQVSAEISPGAAASDGLGCVALLKGELDRAERFFIQALESDSSYSEALGNLALLYEQTGELDLAERYYLSGLDKDPGNFRIRNNYAIFLAQRERADPEKVRRHLLRAAILHESPIVAANLERLLQ